MNELTWSQRGRLWLRLGLRLILCLLALWAALRLGPPLISLFAPFLLALLMSWVLSPAVSWLHKKTGASRRFLSLFLLLLVFALLVGGLWALTSAAVREIVSLAGNWEGLVVSLQGVSDTLAHTFARLLERLPDVARETVEGLAQRFFQWLEEVLPALLSAAMDGITTVAKGVPSFAVAAVVFVMASYFITADYPRFRANFTDRLPDSSRYFLGLVKRAASAGFGGYVKAELLLSVGVFFILLAGFWLIHQPYALLLALALAVLDFIPIVGSGTAMVPWAVIDLLTKNVRHAVGLMVVWGLVALFRRLAEPKILGDQTGLSPILSLVSVYVGMQVAGVVGMILGPVLCLVVLSIARSGVLDNTRNDIHLACRDIAAILKGGEEPET